jgi:putative nucleotidyltransferase with HDIG domain
VSEPLTALRRVAGSTPAWLVGGAPRDRALGRPTADFDVTIDGDPKRFARALAREGHGHPFKLSDGFGVWRVVAHDRDWQLDLLPLAGETIEFDLAQRDFTINAIAEPLAGGPPVDPFGGLEDLRAERVRMVSAEAFERDPVRVMRLARIACELGFSVDPQTASAAHAHAPGLARAAPERVFYELMRIIRCDRAPEGLALMDSAGAIEVVLPELAQLRGVEQSRFHHLDVYDHTLAVLEATIELERDPGAALGEHADAVRTLLAQPFAHELTRGDALRFGALFHDIAKPQTRGVSDSGRVTFIGHDVAGADVAAGSLRRLRAGERLIEHVGALARNHLRLGFLVHSMPLSRRQIYRYLLDTDPVQVDVTVLSVADRLATRGDNAEAATALHLELARELLGEALAWEAHPPRPPVDGNQLLRALGVMPGPEIGRLLAELQEASFAGEVSGPDETLALARELHARSR